MSNQTQARKHSPTIFVNQKLPRLSKYSQLTDELTRQQKIATLTETQKQKDIEHFAILPEFMAWFDKLPIARKMFINEYGVQAYAKWKNDIKAGRRVSLRTFEQEVRSALSLPPGSPIVDEYERTR